MQLQITFLHINTAVITSPYFLKHVFEGIQFNILTFFENLDSCLAKKMECYITHLGGGVSFIPL